MNCDEFGDTNETLRGMGLNVVNGIEVRTLFW